MESGKRGWGCYGEGQGGGGGGAYEVDGIKGVGKRMEAGWIEARVGGLVELCEMGVGDRRGEGMCGD